MTDIQDTQEGPSDLDGPNGDIPAHVRTRFAGNDTLLSLTTKLYDGMEERANKGVYVGSITKLFDELRLPQAYYSRITQQLKKLGYAEQIERGAPGRPSVWKLWHRPDPDTWKLLYVRRGEGLTPPPGRDTLTSVSNRVEALEKRLGGLNVVTAIAELSKEIQKAQERIDGLSTATE